jgi:hypothetical protein
VARRKASRATPVDRLVEEARLGTEVVLSSSGGRIIGKGLRPARQRNDDELS